MLSKFVQFKFSNMRSNYKLDIILFLKEFYLNFYLKNNISLVGQD